MKKDLVQKLMDELSITKSMMYKSSINVDAAGEFSLLSEKLIKNIYKK